MAIQCPQCGAEYDVTLFAFGRSIRCECGERVDLAAGHRQAAGERAEAMADPKGDKLYVNLSAAHVRRRLKGFGHGVRKVQSAGKNRAVVIHTATGQHLEELKAVFGDTKVSDSEEGPAPADEGDELRSRSVDQDR